METNETFAPIPPPPGLLITNEAKVYLRQAGSWASFLGALGFIACTLLLMTALFVGTLFSVILKMYSPSAVDVPAGVGVAMSFILILADILYFFFALYLFQFGQRVKRGITFNDANQVTSALAKLKSFFKLWGLVTIVILCLWALDIGYVIVAGLKFSSLQH